MKWNTVFLVFALIIVAVFLYRNYSQPKTVMTKTVMPNNQAQTASTQSMTPQQLTPEQYKQLIDATTAHPNPANQISKEDEKKLYDFMNQKIK